MPKPIKHTEDPVESALKVMRKATEDDAFPKATASREPTQEIISAVMRVLGRRGGLKGGPARKAALGPRRRRKIAKEAAQARWRKQKTEA